MRHPRTSDVQPYISDHAVLRYLERRHGIDMDLIRAEMTSETLSVAVDMGAISVSVPGGELRLQGSTVVTFIGKDKRRHSPRFREASE